MRRRRAGPTDARRGFRFGCPAMRRLDGMVAGLDDTLMLGPVKARIDSELQSGQSDHWQRLLTEMTGPRYLAVLSDVADWVVEPPWTPAARKPPTALKSLVRRARRKVSRRLENANDTRHIHVLHGTRKAAKGARCAAEAAEPVIGRNASEKQAKRYQKLQDLLGEHQDCLISADVLRRLGAKAGTTEGENGFAFGILHELEDGNVRAARDKARRTARKYG
jgi:CHAD domain-containing protein